MVRSFSAKARLLAIEQGPAPGKTVFDPVPIADGRFTQLPTEKYDFCAQQAGKIDETLFNALTDATVTLDLFDATFDVRYYLSNSGVLLQSVHEIRRLGIQMFMTYDCLALVSQLQDIFPDPFSQRSHGGQQRIGFFHGEQSRKRDRGDHFLSNVTASYPRYRESIPSHCSRPIPFRNSRSSAILSEWPVIVAVIAPRTGFPSK